MLGYSGYISGVLALRNSFVRDKPGNGWTVSFGVWHGGSAGGSLS